MTCLLIPAALMLAGWCWLLRFDRDLPVPSAPMLTWGAAGMLAGLAWDAHGVTLSLAAASCASSSDVLAMLRFHWSTLPAMDLCMVAGSIVGMWSTRRGVSAVQCAAEQHHARSTSARSGAPELARGFAFRAGCCVAMFCGMSLGVIGAQQIAGFIQAYAADPAMRLAVMIGGMFAGMTWGMVAFAAIVRVAPPLRRNRLARA